MSADIGYNDWIAVGMALYDSLGEGVGLSVWDYWSGKGSKYAGRAALDGHWRSFGNRPFRLLDAWRHCRYGCLPWWWWHCN